MNKFEVLDGKISVANLRSAFEQIRHRPEDEQITALIDKLDIDHDGFVPLEDVTSLAEVEGLGIVIDETADELIGQGQEIREVEPAVGSAGGKDVKADSTSTLESKKAKKEEAKRLKREDVVEG